MHERINEPVLDVISFDNYETVTNTYPPEEYTKLASILMLRKIGLPVLPGYVINKLDSDTINFLSNWALSTKSERLSLRFDSPHPQDLINLSSLNPSLDELKEMSHLIKPPLIGLVLAENDRYQQGHSVLMQFLTDRIRCDIVGPGFDAGDITRGKVTPHETIEIVHKNCEFDLDLSPLDIINHTITHQGHYDRSRRLRYGGIYVTIKSALGKSISPRELDTTETQEVDVFLSNREAAIPYIYEPLGWSRLAEIYSYLVVLDTFRKYHKEEFGIDVTNKVLSSSFLRKYGLVFWDFYSGRKYLRNGNSHIPNTPKTL